MYVYIYIYNIIVCIYIYIYIHMLLILSVLINASPARALAPRSTDKNRSTNGATASNARTTSARMS